MIVCSDFKHSETGSGIAGVAEKAFALAGCLSFRAFSRIMVF